MYEHNVEINTDPSILRYQAEVNRRACETGAHEVALWVWPRDIGKSEPFPRTEAGKALVRVLACNTIVFNSQFFDGFYDPEKHDVMCAYCQIVQEVDVPGSVKHEAVCTGIVPPMEFTVVNYPRKEKRVRWKVSLYSTKPEIDCGAICKTFLGGGHKSAAGFVCDVLPWEAK